MVLQFARIFEQIDLYVAVSPEADTQAVAEKAVGWNSSITKIPLRGWAGANHCARVCQHAHRFRCNVNYVNSCEAFAQQTLGCQESDWRAAILRNTSRNLRRLLGNVHVNGKLFAVGNAYNFFQIIQRDCAHAVWSDTCPRHSPRAIQLAEVFAQLFEVFQIHCRIIFNEPNLLRIHFRLET